MIYPVGNPRHLKEVERLFRRAFSAATQRSATQAKKAAAKNREAVAPAADRKAHMPSRVETLSGGSERGNEATSVEFCGCG